MNEMSVQITENLLLNVQYVSGRSHFEYVSSQNSKYIKSLNLILLKIIICLLVNQVLRMVNTVVA